MRMLVMFDLPTGSKEERKTYSEFRKFLIEDGYLMEQFSVYSRVMLGIDNLETHLRRLEEHAPSAGRITVITMTERQFASRKTLVCSSHYQPQTSDLGAQMTLIL